jgi:branched-chain amino acid transport system permease protein
MAATLPRFDRAKIGVVVAVALGAAGYLATAGYDSKLLRAASVVALVVGISSIIIAILAAYTRDWFRRRPGLGRLAQYLLTGTVVAGAALAPTYVDQVPHFSMLKLTVAVTYMMVILGLNLLTGFGGQISLGHSAFFAIGGYTTGIMKREWGISWGWSIPVAAVLAGGAGFLFGLPALRLKGLYLALATLALAVAVSPILKKFEDFTGGVQGIVLFGKIDPLFGDKTDRVFRDRFFYYTTAMIAGVMFLIAWNLVRGRFGRALIAIRDSETAAAAMGVNVALYKTTTFGISAAYAGVAGALNAVVIQFVGPDQYSLALSIRFLVGAVVGGLASVAGAVFGGLFEQFTPDFTADINKAAPDAIFAGILIVLMYVMPTGMVGYVRRIWRYGVERLYLPGAQAASTASAVPRADSAGRAGGDGPS